MSARRRLAACLAAAALAPAGAFAAAEAPRPPALDWSFDGVFGHFDRAEVQRGLQVYLEVCASCHGLDYVAYRDLAGIGYDSEQIKAIAALDEVEDGPDANGDMFMRAALPADRFANPYPNAKAAAAANGGAAPPDLSLMAKAREGGADYIAALLTGYVDSPEGADEREGQTYNAYFPGHWIAMPPPLWGGDVEYADGTEATVAREARDVAAFLAWAAEPELERRKRLGFTVLLFTLALTALLYASKRKIWKDARAAPDPGGADGA